MKLNSLTPLLRTRRLQETIDWYVGVLGFTCTANVPEWGFGRVQLDEADIMLATPNEHESFDQPALTGSLYLNTTDAAGWWEKLKDKCRVCYPLETFDYGMKEFGVYDINGYLLQFGQVLEEDV